MEGSDDKLMYAEQVSLPELAREVGTPLYVYSSEALIERYKAIAKTNPNGLICYSVKANGNISVIRTLAQHGAGADVVSGGELYRALQAGVSPEKIVFAGVGKTEDEMGAALDANIFQINIESEPELEQLNSVALNRGTTAPVAVRVNPDVDANTHNKIATGRSGDKFGVPYEKAIHLYKKIESLKGVKATGLATHIGSQLTDLEPFEMAFSKISQLACNLKSKGHQIENIDFGGGLGIRYSSEDEPSLLHYASIVSKAASAAGCRIILEPGRWITAPAGILLTRVIYVKRTEARNFAIVDCAMNDFMRPALYDAWHEIKPVIQTKESPDKETVDVVGPICESGDFLAHDRDLPPLAPGNLLAILNTGAYGASMSSHYNSRIPASEVLVKKKKWSIIRKNSSIEAFVADENIAEWLTE
tara:strand:+ start:27505 stop:28758 length:1254 start_codon:yes stop_codon:yes gene_type:complete